MVGYKAVVGKYEGLGGWVSQVLKDGPSRIEKLAQCLVSRVESGSPTLLVRLVQHSYFKMPRTFQRSSLKPPVRALWSRVSEPGETEVWVQPRQITRAFRVAAGEVGGNHFRSISFLAVAGMRSVLQVGLQRPLEAPFRGSRSRVLAAARACVQGDLLHPAWGQHHTQEIARPGKAGVRPANPSLRATLRHNLTCIWSFPGSELAGWEPQHTPGSWTNPRTRMRCAMPEG